MTQNLFPICDLDFVDCICTEDVFPQVAVQ